MANDHNFESALKNSTIAFNGLMVLGFLGIVWLMIYGNLSGNLGFSTVSISPDNETISFLEAGSTPASAQNRVAGALTNVVVTNATGAETLTSANYTISGVVITAVSGSGYKDLNVNVSYTVTYDSDGKANTENVINNLTGGANTFFGFSNVLFTIVAIVLLITLLLALLFVVLGITRAMSKKEGTFGG